VLLEVVPHFFERLGALGIDGPFAGDHRHVRVGVRIDAGFTVHGYEVFALPAFLELQAGFLLVGAFKDPAFDVVNVLRIVAEAVPHVTGVAHFLGAFCDFKAFHGVKSFLFTVNLII
jgi:hypothetical protein